MPQKRPAFKIAIAQFSPVLGDVAKNLATYERHIDDARSAGASLVVFPELSLVGYFLRDVVPDVAMDLTDTALRALAERSGDIDIIAGLVEESSEHRFYNSAMLFSQGRVAGIHRKVYLPTYGLFDEQRYFASGERIRAIETPYGRTGVLICEDMWHLSAGIILWQEGVSLIVCPSASPGYGVRGPGGQLTASTRWEELMRVYARFFSVYVVYANRVGYEDGVHFWGGSQVVAPGGNTVAKAGYGTEELLVATIEPEVVRRHRIFSPLGRDEKIDLTMRELARVARARDEVEYDHDS